MAKRWLMQEADPEAVARLAAELGVSPLLAGVLWRRGFQDPQAARAFLWGGLETLADPALLPDVFLALARIRQAIENQEKILVYGDYDVDGVTGTALLLLVLRQLGALVDYYLPRRLEEGYGLNGPAVEEAARAGVRLIITVDCGITSIAEVELAARQGLDVIITDHHEPGTILPPALAVINPKRPDARYPFRELAGVGVAFQLARALVLEMTGAEIGPALLDLVALGTVADVVPLTGENRVLVREGLKYLAQGCRPGVRALLEVTGLIGRVITAGQVGFLLAPRLNAGGRLGSAARGVELLLAEDDEKARRLAQELDAENKKRQQVEEEILQEALTLVAAEVNLEEEWGLVLASPNWHPGVIGIVASRLVERFYRPVFLISLQEGLGKGSGRSIPGFPLHEAMAELAPLLVKFGGHEQAGGLSIDPANIDAFRQGFNRLCRERLRPEDLIPALKVEGVLTLGEVNLGLVAQLELLAPYGPGNPVPNFLLPEVRILESRAVGAEGQHLRLKLQDQKGQKVWTMAFGQGNAVGLLRPGQTLDVAIQLERRLWNGEERIEHYVKDFQLNPARHSTILRAELAQVQREVAAAGERDPFPDAPSGLVEPAGTATGKVGPDSWPGGAAGVLPRKDVPEDRQRGETVSTRSGAGLETEAGGRKGEVFVSPGRPRPFRVHLYPTFFDLWQRRTFEVERPPGWRVGWASGLHWRSAQEEFLAGLADFDIILTTMEFLLYHLSKQDWLQPREIVWHGKGLQAGELGLDWAGLNLLPAPPEIDAEKIQVVAPRERKEKEEYLDNLLLSRASRGGSVLICATEGHLAKRPFPAVQGGKDQRLLYFLLGPGSAGPDLRKTGEGLFPISAGGPGAGPGRLEISDVVFLSVPHSLTEFLIPLEGLVEGARVHLVFDEEDFAFARQRLDFMSPEREFLVELYRLVKAFFAARPSFMPGSPGATQSVPAKGPGLDQLAAETSNLARRGPNALPTEPDWPGFGDDHRKEAFLGLAEGLLRLKRPGLSFPGYPPGKPVPRGVITAGLLVFWELGLLAQAGTTITFQPPPGKLDLSLSLRYREARRQQKELERVAHLLWRGLDRVGDVSLFQLLQEDDVLRTGFSN